MKNDYKSYIEVIPMSVNLCLEETSHPSKHAYTYIFLIDPGLKSSYQEKANCGDYSQVDRKSWGSWKEGVWKIGIRICYLICYDDIK